MLDKIAATHIIQEQKLECCQYTGDNLSFITDFINSNGAECEVSMPRGYVRVKFPDVKSAGLSVGGWVCVNEKGIITIYPTNDAFETAGLVAIERG